jgi:hypothetical protein
MYSREEEHSKNLELQLHPDNRKEYNIFGGGCLGDYIYSPLNNEKEA